VIKIERPSTGDLCRQLYISNLELDGDSTLFHSINRNKRSYAADLKDPGSRGEALATDRLRRRDAPELPAGRDATGSASAGRRSRELNPRIVYGSVSGYGATGPWVDLPGQDLLAQSLSGLVWLSGDAAHGARPDAASPSPT
jgi:CoA:oxalate CoA-transferase